MGIFGGEEGGGFGSLGAGAPDTGRGDAFDRLAASRGYGPLTPPGQPIPTGGFANVRLHGRRGVPIPSGGFVDVTALQGLGAAARTRAPVRARVVADASDIARIRELRLKLAQAISQEAHAQRELLRIRALIALYRGQLAALGA